MINITEQRRGSRERERGVHGGGGVVIAPVFPPPHSSATVEYGLTTDNISTLMMLVCNGPSDSHMFCFTHIDDSNCIVTYVSVTCWG